VLGDESTKPGEAEHLTFGVMSLYQPIAVEQHTVTLCKRDLSLFVAHPRHDP